MLNAPLHEILQGAGILEQQAISSILPANGQLEDTVIVRMLLHYAERAYPTVKVAVLHPEFVARFYVTTADGAYEGMALLNDISDQNKASNYLYGVQQGFDVLLIPIHKRAQMDGGEHWMLGIFEASFGERQLLVCDPVDNPLPIDAVLRKILRHVLNTVVTNEKLKGCIVKPRNAYNHQDDASSCGVYIVFYARQYLSHRRLFLDKNFQEADERKQIYEFVVNSDQFNRSGPSEAASFTSLTNMHALNIQDPMITPLRPTRAVKQRSKERISDILMELNASQREKYRDYERRRRKKETMRGRNIRLEEQRRRNERLRRAAKSFLCLEMGKQKVENSNEKGEEIDRRREMKRLSMRRSRERLKYENPDKYEEIKKKNREYQKTRKKIDEMTELEKKQVRKKWRERSKIHREKKKEVKQASSPAHFLQDVTSIYPVPTVKTEILDPSEQHEEFILPDSIQHATALDPTLVVKTEIQDSPITNQFILPIIKEEPIDVDYTLDISRTEDLYEGFINNEIESSLFFKYKLTKCSVLLHDCLIPKNLASISAQFISLRINTDIPKLNLFPLSNTPFLPHISEAYKELAFPRCKSCSYQKKRLKCKNKVQLNNFKKKRGPYKVKTKEHICSCFKASEDAMLSECYENFSQSTQQLCSCLTNDYMLTESTDMLMKEIAVFDPEFGKITSSINKIS